MMAVEIKKIVLNGNEVNIEAPSEKRVLDVLRNDLQLTGTKEGCGEGECGACSIVLGDEVVNSCLILFGQLGDGDRIITIEGVEGTEFASLQEAFASEGGAQCGICTPGMIMASYVLLKNNPNPTRDEIADALAGNLCRCTGYVKIIDSVVKAAGEIAPNTVVMRNR